MDNGTTKTGFWSDNKYRDMIIKFCMPKLRDMDVDVTQFNRFCDQNKRFFFGGGKW